MVINWYGESCFKIQSGETTILTDPIDNTSGLSAPRFRADATLFSVTPDPLPYPSCGITGAGEYGIKNIEINGWPNKSTVVYLIKMDDMRIVFLGQLKEPLEPSVLERMDNIDLLFLPAGGKPFIEQREAAQIIKKISPKIVIASLFKIPGLKRKANDLKEFLKEIKQKAEPQEKLAIKKNSLPAQTQIVILKV